MSKTVKEIVAEYLTANGFDGLFNDPANCGCQISDLMPCGQAYCSCEAGYKAPSKLYGLEEQPSWIIQGDKPK